jgi:NAD+ kinase
MAKNRILMMVTSYLKPCFERVLIVTKESTDPDGLCTEKVRAFLSNAGLTVRCSQANFFDGCQVLQEERLNPPDLVIVIGGDGTFLRVAQQFAPTEVPMVGINRGNLGFLTRIETTALEPYLLRIIEGDFKLESRLLLEITPPASLAVQYGDYFLALNDLVIKTQHPSQMARLILYIDELAVANYDADGLIISTPTGSTAYNLAAGGPAMAPDVEALLVTPICPHSLSAKPIVVPTGVTLRVQAADKNLHPLVFSLDGQDPLLLETGEMIVVRRSEVVLKLLNFDLNEDNFYWLLRQKLAWAANPRQQLRL